MNPTSTPGSPPFERIRRITGYLVGTTDRFNDGKKAEERDRVHHTVGLPVDLFKYEAPADAPAEKHPGEPIGARPPLGCARYGTLLRLAGVVGESSVDGPGFRLGVFAQGCPHRCRGCHNPATFAFDGGILVAVSSVVELLTSNPMHSGISLSGGEPFEQAAAFARLAERARELGYDVMAWTGYTFEELIVGSQERPEWLELLSALDVLVDGPYIQELHSLALLYRGSANQRVLDVPESLKAGAPVLWEAAYEQGGEQSCPVSAPESPWSWSRNWNAVSP